MLCVVVWVFHRQSSFPDLIQSREKAMSNSRPLPQVDEPPDPDNQLELTAVAQQPRVRIQTMDEYLNDEKVSRDIRDIANSHYASFPDPKSNFQKIIVILNVSKSMRLKDKQFGAEFCPITTCYRELVKEGLPIPKVEAELKIALKNYRENLAAFSETKARRQASVTDFFKKVNISQDSTSSSKHDSENNTSSKSAGQSKNVPLAQKSATSNNSLSGLLIVLGIEDVVDGSKIEGSIKMDARIIESKETVSLLQKFLSLRVQFEKKSVSTLHKHSAFSADLRKITEDLDEFKADFMNLDQLCDKEKNMRIAQSLEMSEMGKFMSSKYEEANSICKRMFLKLNSGPFKSFLRRMIHEFQKRLSHYKMIEKAEAEGGSLSLVCFNPDKTWDECLQLLMDQNWQPTSNVGEMSISHFERCKDFFVAMELRGDQFVFDSELLEWLGIKTKRASVLDTLIKNLPIIQIKRGSTSILINVICFLNDREIMTEFMALFQEREENSKDQKVPDENLHKEVPPNLPRKPGSGRPRIIEQNPEIFDVVKDFAESAGHGLAAHGRRQDEVGRFGFSMPDLRKQVQEKLFKENPDKAPSEKTLRRLFEAPTKKANSHTRYRADIRARPGTHKNDAASGEDRHPHQHQCFTIVRLIRYSKVIIAILFLIQLYFCREFFALHSPEGVVMSCDNKCKIPVGVSAVNRLSSVRQKFFMTGEQPDHADHDIRSGRMINPEGYQVCEYLYLALRVTTL